MVGNFEIILEVHDLTTNPKDLPPLETNVLVFAEWLADGSDYTSIGMRIRDEKQNKEVWLCADLYDVLAWAYIPKRKELR